MGTYMRWTHTSTTPNQFLAKRTNQTPKQSPRKRLRCPKNDARTRTRSNVTKIITPRHHSIKDNRHEVHHPLTKAARAQSQRGRLLQARKRKCDWKRPDVTSRSLSLTTRAQTRNTRKKISPERGMGGSFLPVCLDDKFVRVHI